MKSQDNIETQPLTKMSEAETWQLIAVFSIYFVLKGIWLLSWFTYLPIPEIELCVPIIVLDTIVLHLYQKPIAEPQKLIKIYLGTMIIVTILWILGYLEAERPIESADVFWIGAKIIGSILFMLLPIALSFILLVTYGLFNIL